MDNSPFQVPLMDCEKEVRVVRNKRINKHFIGQVFDVNLMDKSGNLNHIRFCVGIQI